MIHSGEFMPSVVWVHSGGGEGLDLERFEDCWDLVENYENATPLKVILLSFWHSPPLHLSLVELFAAFIIETLHSHQVANVFF